MRLEFVTVDVFTDRKFGGNPLAVVLDAHGLTTEQMQAIAAEFNLAETTFVLPPKDAAHDAEVRIFTPRAEMPFAGHPNVGTAFVLATEAKGAFQDQVVHQPQRRSLIVGVGLQQFTVEPVRLPVIFAIAKNLRELQLGVAVRRIGQQNPVQKPNRLAIMLLLHIHAR